MLHRHAQYSGAETRRQFERAHRDDPWAVERKPFPFWSLTWRAALCVAIVAVVCAIFLPMEPRL